MKLKIKVKELTEGCMPVIKEEGDWIDLFAAEDVELRAAQAGTQYQENLNRYRDVSIPYAYIPLGVAMMLPDGFEAIVASRSGNPKKTGTFIPVGIGVIDNCYNGNNDEWKYIVSPLSNTTVAKGDRICQFRIQLSQKATFKQKLKWLFSSGVELVKTEELNETDRGMNVTGLNK